MGTEKQEVTETAAQTVDDAIQQSYPVAQRHAQSAIPLADSWATAAGIDNPVFLPDPKAIRRMKIWPPRAGATRLDWVCPTRWAKLAHPRRRAIDAAFRDDLSSGRTPTPASTSSEDLVE